MPRILNQGKRRLGPSLVQRPSGGWRADNIVTTLNDLGGYMANRIDIFEELIGCFKKAAIHKVMALDTRHRKCCLWLI